MCVLLWWLAAPWKDTCSTDECKEKWVGFYNIMYPRDPLKANWVNANHKLTDVYGDIYIPVKVRLINKLFICCVNIQDKVFKLSENDHQSLYVPYGGACIVLVMC